VLFGVIASLQGMVQVFNGLLMLNSLQKTKQKQKQNKIKQNKTAIIEIIYTQKKFQDLFIQVLIFTHI
jgi:hypothetical protein